MKHSKKYAKHIPTKYEQYTNKYTQLYTQNVFKDIQDAQNIMRRRVRPAQPGPEATQAGPALARRLGAGRRRILCVYIGYLWIYLGYIVVCWLLYIFFFVWYMFGRVFGSLGAAEQHQEVP